MMGPINGDMSIAPMITAVELTFSPSEAMKIAVIRIHRLEGDALSDLGDDILLLLEVRADVEVDAYGSKDIHRIRRVGAKARKEKLAKHSPSILSARVS